MKLIAEGVEAQVPYKGALAALVFQLVGGLRSRWATWARRRFHDMQEKSRFVRVTSASTDESHPHDVIMTSRRPTTGAGRGFPTARERRWRRGATMLCR